MTDDDNVNSCGGQRRLDVACGMYVDTYFVIWVFYDKVMFVVERTRPVF